MKQLGKVLGGLGALLVVVVLLNYLITKEFSVPFQVIGFAGIALVFFFVYAHIDELIDTFGSRSARYGSIALLLTGLCLVVLGLVNFIAFRHPQRYDATEAKLFSLSPQTLQVVKDLKEPIQITTFFSADGPEKKKFQDLADGYRSLSDKIKITYVDPERDPMAVKQFAVTALNTVVVAQGKNEKRITATTEEALTNAIIAVTRTTQKKVCFLEGHGEKSPEDAEKEGMSEAKAALEKQSFVVEKLALYKTGEIPAECKVLVVAGPTKPLLDPEKPKLEDWVKKGGRLIYMLDPDTDPALAQFLTTFGVKAAEDIVVDPAAQMALGNAAAPIGLPVAQNKITDELQRTPTFFPLARSLSRADVVPEGNTVEFLLQTASEQAWGETDLSLIKPGGNPDEPKVPTQDDKDIKGPLNLAALVTVPVKKATDKPASDDKAAESKDDKEQKGMMAAFGDSDFASNAYFHSSVNGDLFLNTVSFLAEEEDLLAIRPKEAGKQTLSMTQAQSGFVMYLSILIMPAIPALLGIYTWLRKRNL